jgi:hypothetical protein
VSAATPWSHVEAETPAQKDDGGEGEAIVSFFHVHSMSTRRL